MKLYVTRHGQTNWNAATRVMGRVNKPLNKTGIEQAKQTATKLANENIDLILCSPLRRAKRTAKIINKGRNIPVIYDKRLIERNFGEFEGKKKETFGYLDYWNYYKNVHYKKAENIREFFERVFAFLDDIINTYKDKNVLIVAHGGISIAIACYFKKEIPKGVLAKPSIVLGNCEVATYDI